MQKDVSSPLPCLLLCEAGGELRRPSTAEQLNDPPCIPLSNLNSMRNALPTQLLALAKITTLAANLVALSALNLAALAVMHFTARAICATTAS